MKSANQKMNTYVDMFAKFRLYQKDENGRFKLLRKDDVANFSVGGFTFEISGKRIPFDFEATAISFDEGIIHYESGYGPFFNAHYLDDAFDEIYELKKIKRSDLTASLLASVSRIEEFYVNFWNHDDEEYGIGDNDNVDPDLRLEIIEICFSDENANCFYVSPDVIRKFNAGCGGSV